MASPVLPFLCPGNSRGDGGVYLFLRNVTAHTTIESIREALETLPAFALLVGRLRTLAPGESCDCAGLAGSALSLVIGSAQREANRPLLLIARDRDAAEQLRDDLALAAGKESLPLFDGNAPGDISTLRTIVAGEMSVVVTHPAALLVNLPAPAGVADRAVTMEIGTPVSYAELIDTLARFGFERKEFVEAGGDYAVRGGIVDVFPYVGENPVRLEFFGETVESIREFDPLSQRSIRELSIAVIVPNLLVAPEEDGLPRSFSLLDYLPPSSIIGLDEPELLRAGYEEAAKRIGEGARPFPETEELLQLFPLLRLASASREGAEFDFGCRPQPSFNNSVAQLDRSIAALQASGTRVVLACDSPAEVARLKDLLASPRSPEPEERGSGSDSRMPEEETGTPAGSDIAAVTFLQHACHHGFILPAARIALFTEHEIFNRLKRRGRKRAPKFKGITDRELQQLRKGDFIVHQDFGIGRYSGLHRIRLGLSEQEVVKVLYAEKDVLYVNLNYVNRLQKYSSKEGHVPKLTRLGSQEWDRLKLRTKNRVKDIARDLIRLYAERKHAPGYAFPPDTPWQKELEASFMYEDTFDQAKTTIEIKQDMEASVPMDRLVCGDVGFGKTEVAVRAAFKCVMDGKQAAVLVPTTILAQQHFHTFVDRTGRYGVQVRVLSRFKPRKEQLEILEGTRRGSVDIVIGTHRLLSKDVAFSGLGLLVIDEEHRFGVTAKEKLRQLRAHVDTLALTATPIPRTLHFSLMGARDLSIIATPPRNRLPIATEMTQWNGDVIRDAVLRELHRGGQVYFVHDRIENMAEILGRLKDLLPGIRMASAHGQMEAHELEEVMMDFVERRIDLLVATKIIESGLDIPNVNTIIINRADRFGMAELYQLRGRVGRSNTQAYAYLLTPPFSTLPQQTIRRLRAVEEFTELGSGFNLAMRDLEIRGAGNLLGAEQSGFIESLGFETYTRILDEAVQELKAEEFHDLLKEGEARRGAHPALHARCDTVVEPEFDAYIPEGYVGVDTERLAIYRRLYGLASAPQLDEAAAELRDRFGQFPTEVENLFGVVRLRLLASRIGFPKVAIAAGTMEVEFPPEAEKAFYEAEQFQQIMHAISRMKGRGVALRQLDSRLKLHVQLPKFAPESDPIVAGLTLLEELCVGSSPTP